MTPPVLYIFSGLPGSGKTTLSRMLSRHLKAAYLRIDTVEQGLRDLCGVQVEGEGYRLSYRIARDNLELGLSVVADSCNPIPLSRDEWQQVAIGLGVGFVDIEISCSDVIEHRHRVETRVSSVENLKLPSWQQVQSREYEPWRENVVRIDTAGKMPDESLAELLEKLAAR